MDSTKTNRCNRIYTDDLFLAAIGYYLQKKQSSTDNINFLTERKYRIKDTDSTYREIFECGVALCMMRKGISLIVFSDGHIEITPRSALTMNESMSTFRETTYLVVSLNRCLEQIFPDKSYLPPLDMFELSAKEISILSTLRSGEYDEITIQLKNGDLERIDTKKGHIGEAEKLADTLSKFSYGDLTIKKQAGKIVFSEVVTKAKL